MPQPGVTEFTQGSALVQTQSDWTTLVDNVRLDNNPTQWCSEGMDTTGLSGLWVLIGVDSNGTPTLLRVLAQWSDDGGTTWWDFEEGLWASLCWEDQDTTSGINKAYLLPCGGIDLIRFCVIGTGTTAANWFEVTVKARGFYPAVPVAHA